MFLAIIYLVIGLILILAGANALTDGSSAIAKRWGVSDLVIGLTVVAFGTSAPELVISIVSAINGNAGLAIGNAVGSNIFNILAVIGVTAMIRPLRVEKSVLTSDIPFVVLSALLLQVMGNGPWLDGTPDSVLTRVDGITLLLFFAIFMRYTFSQVSNPTIPSEPEQPDVKTMPLWKASVWIIGGLAALIFGGDRFVAGASSIASSMGVSDTVIGLTVVAVGTSLPEFATTIVAALKGNAGMAIGNVIGSNIFNIFLVLGCSATIRPLGFGDIGNIDLGVLTASCVLFWIFGWFFSHRTITRAEGALLAAGYIVYMAYIIANA